MKKPSPQSVNFTVTYAENGYVIRTGDSVSGYLGQLHIASTPTQHLIDTIRSIILTNMENHD